jgi:hypothetical protein
MFISFLTRRDVMPESQVINDPEDYALCMVTEFMECGPCVVYDSSRQKFVWWKLAVAAGELEGNNHYSLHE